MLFEMMMPNLRNRCLGRFTLLFNKLPEGEKNEFKNVPGVAL